MPVRSEVPAKKATATKADVAPKEEAPKKVATLVRSTAKAPEPVIPEESNAPEPELASKKGSVTTVSKYPLEEKVKKYLATVRPDLVGCINEVLNQEIKASTEKVTVCFMTFSPNGSEDEAIDETFNVQAIKDILFDYHTVPEKAPTGKQLVIEVLKPEAEGEPTMVLFQEV